MFNVPGRPTGSLRGPRSWFSLFAHRHLHVIPHNSFSPQFGVQENPRAREVLKGPSESLLKVRFFLPEAPVGYQSIRPLSYRLFFLKNSGKYYEFVSPYCPSIVAAPGIRAQGNSVLDRVVGQVAGVLQSPRSPIEQKREAVYVLSRTESPAATIAL